MPPPQSCSQTVTPENFAKQLNVSRETLEALSAYVALLEKWQPRINLISPASLPDIWQRHMFDSAQLLAHMPEMRPAAPHRILDIGSGAGFPGLVLAILGAGQVQLVESDQRKSVFLQTVIRELGVSATVVNDRIESLPACYPDVITARALAPLPKLMQLIDAQMHPGLTCLFLKGAKVEEELTNFQTYSTMTSHLYPSLSHPAGMADGEANGVIVKLTMPQ
ncbi:16S rRNA (guanine(527)-N(7))-methyltransferase RsmG [Alphaproteobacteria bacterium]|nr:16S rRNA (guanine(527)-N(7))-methyltransferase RsmG [Alphaproteobacteria bacterium]